MFPYGCRWKMSPAVFEFPPEKPDVPYELVRLGSDNGPQDLMQQPLMATVAVRLGSL